MPKKHRSPSSSVPRVVVALVAPLTLSLACPPVEERPRGFRAVSFDDDFAFGTAIAQWQAEGDHGAAGEVDSNWHRWAAQGKTRGLQQNPSGNGFFDDYAADIQRAKDLGLDTFRFSIDWARVVPEPGVIDEAELDHLDDVLDAVVAADMRPMLTLYHWTVPAWVQNPDGDAPEGKIDLIAAKDRAVVDAWEQFVRAVIPRVKDRVDLYSVMNEPLSMIVVGYIDGRFPPGEFFNIPKATDFGINLMFMHARAFDAIKELDDVDADGDRAPSFVGLTMTAGVIYPERPGNAQEELAAESLNYVYNDWVVNTLTSGELDVNLDGQIDEGAPTDPAEGVYDELKDKLEWIGVQYYGPAKVKEGELLSNTPPLYGLPLLDVADYSDPAERNKPHNGMGREISAAGFADTLDRYAQWRLPIIITENGTTTNLVPDFDDDDPNAVLPAPVLDEDQAAMYLVTHVWEVGRAQRRGIDIRGYVHWTLADNFEWVDGRLQRFGAYAVDFDSEAAIPPRRLTKMGEALRDIVAARGVTEAVWNQYVLERFPSDTTAKGLGPTTRDAPIGVLDDAAGAP